MTPSDAPAATATRPRYGRRLLLAVGGVLLLIALIVLVKVLLVRKMMASFKPPAPPVVTTLTVHQEDWREQISAVGSLRASRGADLGVESAGVVRAVPLRAGQQVAAGTALVELNADAERAQLQALQAAEDLSRITLKRDREQFSARAVSQATIDADEADLRSRSAQVAQQKALVEKKIIRAPFAGRVGISTVNPGQYLNTGDKVVTLQADDILLADFNLPQREAGRALAGAQVQVEVDALPGTSFTGQVTAVSPAVDAGTRNLMVEARIANPRHQLVPGMFARVGLRVGAAQRFITLPQAAVTFNPYGATVFVVRPAGPEDAKAAAPGAPPGPAPGTPVARQVFITTGLTRGDQVAVLKGLQEGDVVVTSGQLKLKNGAPLKVDNSTPPPNDAQPAPQEQ